MSGKNDDPILKIHVLAIVSAEFVGFPRFGSRPPPFSPGRTSRKIRRPCTKSELRATVLVEFVGCFPFGVRPVFPPPLSTTYAKMCL